MLLQPRGSIGHQSASWLLATLCCWLLVWLLLFRVKIIRTKSPFWLSLWFDLWGGDWNLVQIFVVDFDSFKSFFSFISPPILQSPLSASFWLSWVKDIWLSLVKDIWLSWVKDIWLSWVKDIVMSYDDASVFAHALEKLISLQSKYI